MSKWKGPFATADEALDEVRKAIATLLDLDTETWPGHDNAPLAIIASYRAREGDAASWRDLKPSIVDVIGERSRQVNYHGMDDHNDAVHTGKELLAMAIGYAEAVYRGSGGRPDVFPNQFTWNPEREDRKTLVKAASLLIAEIQRLDYAEKVLQREREAATVVDAPEEEVPVTPVEGWVPEPAIVMPPLPDWPVPPVVPNA